jgi:hypothetical protein
VLFHCTKPGSSWILELICSDLATSSGACNRSQQIKEVLEKGGYALEPIKPPPRPRRWDIAVSGIKTGLADGFHRPIGLASIRTSGSTRSLLKELKHQYPAIKGFIFEGTGFGSLTGLGWCHRHGLRSVLIPANIESLANYPGAWTHQDLTITERFDHEKPWLSMADAIYTISIEEAWWLELHGIPAQHFPYFPCTEHLNQLESLRNQRQPDRDFGYLLLADFNNAANLTGAKLLAKRLVNGLVVRHPIHVVGRGMEQARCILESVNQHPFIFEGEVSDQQLADFQRRCLALVIFHPATSGMLTRVVDATIANIPVTGNCMALKSYHHCFTDSIINLDTLPANPIVRFRPERPQTAEASLLHTLDS